MLNASWVVPELGPELELGANPGRADVERVGGLEGFVRTWEAVVGSVNGAWILSSARQRPIREERKWTGQEWDTYRTGSLDRALPPTNLKVLAIYATTITSDQSLS